MNLTGNSEVQVWCANAIDVLDAVPRDFDLLLADPPFGKEFVSNRISSPQTIVGDDDQALIDRILAGLWARIKNHRHGYIFGPERQLQAARAPLVWDRVRMASGDLGGLWGSQHVDLWFYAHRYRAEPRAGELAAKLRRGSVIRVPALRGMAMPHPNYKPVGLLQRLIEASTLVGDLVVDPFCGSGSSAIAAAILGRRYIGVELDPEYAKRAADWVDRCWPALQEIRGNG